MNPIILLAYVLTAFTISFLSFPMLIRLLQKWELFDHPTDHKIHSNFTPSMGGICILLGVVFTLLIGLPLKEWAALKYFFIGLAILCVTGLRDDVLTLDPLRKLIGQVLPVIISVIFGKLALTSLYDLHSVQFPLWFGWLITIFTIIILTNAYNLIDGIDGLAGSICLVVFVFFGFWFLLTENLYLAVISFSFTGSVIAFLLFNWQPSKIFMGDTGTLTIGFALSFLAIQFINQNFNLSSESPLHFSASISTAICVLIIPIFDTLRVIILRLRKLQSPFRADRNHLHHQFLAMGFSHQKTTVILAAVNVFFVGLAWALRNQSDRLILPIVFGICIAINQTIKLLLLNRQKYAASSRTT